MSLDALEALFEERHGKVSIYPQDPHGQPERWEDGGMLMSSNFEQLKTDIFTFGDNSLYKGDKINYRIKNKDQFIRRFLRDNPIYKNETHVVLRQVVTHIRTNIWNKLSDMDRYGTIRRPVWDVVTNEEDVLKTLDLLTEEDVQTHTCPENLKSF